jgi:hypothetical protein
MTVQILLAITTASLVPLTNLLLRIWSVCVQNITWTMNMQVMRRVKSRKLGVEINVNQWEKFRAPVANRNHWYNNSWWKWFPNVQNVLILNGCCEPMFLGNICQTGQTGTFLESNGSEKNTHNTLCKNNCTKLKIMFRTCAVPIDVTVLSSMSDKRRTIRVDNLVQNLKIGYAAQHHVQMDGIGWTC